MVCLGEMRPETRSPIRTTVTCYWSDRKDVFDLTKKRPHGLNGEWNDAQVRSHTLDSKLDAFVRFMARLAAQHDYEAQHGRQDRKPNHSGPEDTLQ